MLKEQQMKRILQCALGAASAAGGLLLLGGAAGADEAPSADPLTPVSQVIIPHEDLQYVPFQVLQVTEIYNLPFRALRQYASLDRQA